MSLPCTEVKKRRLFTVLGTDFTPDDRAERAAVTYRGPPSGQQHTAGNAGNGVEVRNRRKKAVTAITAESPISVSNQDGDQGTVGATCPRRRRTPDPRIRLRVVYGHPLATRSPAENRDQLRIVIS